jgi:hypothetical protein
MLRRVWEGRAAELALLDKRMGEAALFGHLKGLLGIPLQN